MNISMKVTEYAIYVPRMREKGFDHGQEVHVVRDGIGGVYFKATDVVTLLKKPWGLSTATYKKAPPQDKQMISSRSFRPDDVYDAVSQGFVSLQGRGSIYISEELLKHFLDTLFSDKELLLEDMDEFIEDCHTADWRD